MTPEDRKEIFQRFMFAYQGESTKRFHTRRTIGQNTVAEHSYSLVWILWLLSEGTASAQLLMAGITHDMAEHKVGDIPAPAKRDLSMGYTVDLYEKELLLKHNWYFDLDAEESRLLKLADIYSGMLFCVTERALGNQLLQDVYNNWSQYAQELCPQIGMDNQNNIEVELWNIIHALWRAVNE